MNTVMYHVMMVVYTRFSLLSIITSFLVFSTCDIVNAVVNRATPKFVCAANID